MVLEIGADAGQIGRDGNAVPLQQRRWPDARQLQELRRADAAGSQDQFAAGRQVRGRLRLDGAVVEERSLVFKQRGTVSTLWRERGGPVRSAGNAPGR